MNLIVHAWAMITWLCKHHLLHDLRIIGGHMLCLFGILYGAFGLLLHVILFHQMYLPSFLKQEEARDEASFHSAFTYAPETTLRCHP